MQRVDSLYICPWSLRDPLCQSQTLAYLFGLVRRGYKFALITIENPRYALDSEQAALQRSELETIGIYWYPIAYHAGLSLTAKAVDNFNGIAAGVKIWRKHKPKIVHSRSSLTAAMALVIAKLCGLRFLYDADSMLSEEYVDVGHWSRRSNGFRAMAATEHLARRAATQIVVLTETLRADLIQEYKVTKPITVIGCCVDTEKYRLSPEARAKRRAELNLADEKLLVYVGKIGGRYLVENTFEFFQTAADKIENLKLLIVSQEPKPSFDRIAEKVGVRETQYFVKSAASAEVAEWLSAADAGLALIKNSKSERGASPIKIAEYLAASLPVIVTNNIGDCSQMITEKNVGVVLKKLNSKSYLETTNQLREILEENANIAARCRMVAEENFSLENTGVARYHEIYRKLL